MGVAQKITFSAPGVWKFFGVSGDLMEYNERGKPVKRLSSLTNPKSAGIFVQRPVLSYTKRYDDERILSSRYLPSLTLHKFIQQQPRPSNENFISSS